MNRVSKSKNFMVAGLCILGIGAMGAFPFYYTKRVDTLQHKEAPLQGSQRLRGMYVPAGQRDAGRDPDWDLKDNQWKGWERKKDYLLAPDIVEKEKERQQSTTRSSSKDEEDK